MEKNAKQIDIVTENCEEFAVPIEHIDFAAKGVSRSMFSCNGDGTILDELTADKLVLIIKPEAFNIPSSMGEELPKLKERLTQYADITHIDVIYDDGTNDYIACQWKGDDEFINEAQSYEYINDNLVITIK